jgi:hypothetical protein
VKNKHAQALGKLGGHARAKKMTAEERSAACREAVNVRWARYRQAQRKTKVHPKGEGSPARSIKPTSAPNHRRP